jgi:hypothetical protein
MREQLSAFKARRTSDVAASFERFDSSENFPSLE